MRRDIIYSYLLLHEFNKIPGDILIVELWSDCRDVIRPYSSHRPGDGAKIGALAEKVDALAVGEARGLGIAYMEVHKGFPDLLRR